MILGRWLLSLSSLAGCAPSSIERFEQPGTENRGQNGATQRTGGDNKGMVHCRPVLSLVTSGLGEPSFDKLYKAGIAEWAPLSDSGFLLASDFQSYREGYLKLWSTIEIRSDRVDDLDRHLSKIQAGKPSYDAVASKTGVPWWWVAITHGLEAGYNFSKHLHNGDPLTARTVHVPAGRPREGSPPFRWEVSATDALGIDDISGNDPWEDVAYSAYSFEKYNGFGYRSAGVNSPYLWSFSNHYSRGKYVADGEFDPNAVSAQAGAMVLLKHAVNKGVVSLSGTGNSGSSGFPGGAVGSANTGSSSQNCN